MIGTGIERQEVVEKIHEEWEYEWLMSRCKPHYFEETNMRFMWAVKAGQDSGLIVW